MTRLALPESEIVPYDLPNDQPSADTDHVAQHYEINKRLNGVSPLPALLVGTDPDKVAIERSPVAMTIDLTSDLGGTDDFVPFAFASRAIGGGWDTSGGVSEGWIFGLNVFTVTGTASGDGAGLEHLYNLIESAHRSDVSIADVVGLATHAAFAGASADAGVAGTITSLKVLAPTRKDGNTGGTATNVYGLYIDPVDPADLGGSFGYSLYIAGGGGAYITGSLGVGTGLGLPDSATIYFGDVQITVDGSDQLVVNQPIVATGLTSSGAVSGTSLVNMGDFDHRFVGWITGSPESIVYAGQGSWALRTDGGVGTTLYVKEGGGTGNTGWQAK